MSPSENNTSPKRSFIDDETQKAAFFASSLESEKSTLRISTAAIGLLVILIKYGQGFSLPLLILYISTLYFFMLTAISVVFILHLNGKYLASKGESTKKIKRQLVTLDYIKLTTFIAGLVCIFSLMINDKVYSRPATVIIPVLISLSFL